MLVIFGGYKLNWDWTGFNGSTKSGKTLWDWMQLLFIPVVLAVAGFWFSHRERKAAELRAGAESEIEQQRAKAEQESASDNQREGALQEYIKEISELLLREKLRESQPGDEVRKIARVRTLMVLPRLDGKRKRNLLLFLYDADLIDRGHRIINISDVDLSEADLSGASLCRFKSVRDSLHKREGITKVSADLTGVNLRNANLNGANLRDVKLGAEGEELMLEMTLQMSDEGSWYEGVVRANLSEAKLVKADLFRAVLAGADLRGADLREAFLGGANLQKADLSLANLHSADLSSETLVEFDPAEKAPDLSGWKGANLSGANLSETNLWQVNLSGANLHGADLRDVEGITNEELKKQAASLQGATLPDGSIHP